MWADPKTCLTVRSSGLPVGRRVQVYSFAPPYVLCPSVSDSNSRLHWSRSLADANLARLSSKLIVSLVYSHDVVSRLSLGSVQDLRSAAMWLCEAEVNGGKADEGWSAVIQRARRWKSSEGSKEDMNWVCLLSVQPLDLSMLTTSKSLSRCGKHWKQICKVPFYSHQDAFSGQCEMGTCTFHTKDTVTVPL